jgi:hypothetical protein
MRFEFKSTIINIRNIEDCIRATKKYTEGVGTMRKKHPIQGEEFPSKVFCKYYEVYPDMDISWEMTAEKAVDWLWGETDHYDLIFKYDYRSNQAELTVINGNGALNKLKQSIPGLKDALAVIDNVG